jgi:hypothetical protein
MGEATAGANGQAKAASVSAPAADDALRERIRQAIADAGGWLPFDRFMTLALYEPGLGYYARGDRQFGLMPDSGSDFVTAPELSPLFGRALAAQVAQALKRAVPTPFTNSARIGCARSSTAGCARALDGRAFVQRYAIVELRCAARAPARASRTLRRAGAVAVGAARHDAGCRRRQ